MLHPKNKTLFVLLSDDNIYENDSNKSCFLIRKYKKFQIFLLNPRSPEYMLIFGPAETAKKHSLTKKDILVTKNIYDKLPEKIFSDFNTVYTVTLDSDISDKKTFFEVEDIITKGEYDLLVLLFCDPLGCGYYPLDKLLLNSFTDKIYVVNGRRRFFKLTKKYLHKIYLHRLYRKYPVFEPFFLLLLLVLLPFVAIVALLLLIRGSYHYG